MHHKRKKQNSDVKMQEYSKKYDDPRETLKSDVKRKREEIKNSTLGGF